MDFRAVLSALVGCGVIQSLPALPYDPRGAHFVAFDGVAGFARTEGSTPREIVWTSREIESPMPWEELIASWNVDLPKGAYVRIEARASDPDRTTKFFVLGTWSNGDAQHPRESAKGQRDDDGDVLTDTLVLKRSAAKAQIRVVAGGEPRVRFLGVCFTGARASAPPLPALRTAWGKSIDVPRVSQMAYPNGNVLCSPTSVSMVLAHWSNALHRPELNRDVPEVAKEVFDAKWPGTGNWPFNTAYAGSHAGMRAYVSRFTGVPELEAWIDAGIPVVASVSYDVLKEKKDRRANDGHLLVCVGFTASGDVVTNDPGRSDEVRRVYGREIFERAWAASKNTVYLIYPENAAKPANALHHWE